MAPCYGWRSPHTRGARGQALRRLGPRRIIPAYAGSTPESKPPPAGSANHPRIRGEHAFTVKKWAKGDKSSPHTRGAQILGDTVGGARGIIPAYAGSTSTGPTTIPRRSDHPRIRGEHSGRRLTPHGHHGSSPHTRGAHNLHPRNRSPRRIIPAYAGSTNLHHYPREMRWDHPRIRGEHAADYMMKSRFVESSPHTRGALPPGAPASTPRRIIPAYAGSTSG